MLLRRLRVRGAGLFGLVSPGAYFVPVQIGAEQSTRSVPPVIGVAGAGVFALCTAIVAGARAAPPRRDRSAHL